MFGIHLQYNPHLNISFQLLDFSHADLVFLKVDCRELLFQQSKFFKVKSSMYPLFMSAASHMLRKLAYFYIAYYVVLGSVIKQYIINSLSIHHR